jgi:hypothetical protein
MCAKVPIDAITDKCNLAQSTCPVTRLIRALSRQISSGWRSVARLKREVVTVRQSIQALQCFTVVKLMNQFRSTSRCPRCLRDLSQKKTFGPYTMCPFCETELGVVWWQRYCVVALAAGGLLATLHAVGFWGLLLLFAFLLLFYPALAVVTVLTFRLIAPRYIESSTFGSGITRR